MMEGRWNNLWTPVSEDGYCGFVLTLDEAEQVRKAFEVDKCLTFVSGKRAANFGNHVNDLPSKFRLRFNDIGEHETVKSTGLQPFIILSKYERHCLFGKDKNKRKKEKDQNSRNEALSCRVMEYDTIIGVYHQRGHWDLVVIEPKTFTVYFYNPLGETAFQCRQVLNGWRNYMGRNMFLSVQWKLEVKEHSKQKDGSSCGVYCLMFAERHLGGESLLNISKEDVERKRAEVGSTLMLFDEHMVDCCPCCGLTMSDCKGDMVTCGVCLRKFHRKNYCVGELIVNMSVQNFTCKECSLKSNVQY